MKAHREYFCSECSKEIKVGNDYFALEGRNDDKRFCSEVCLTTYHYGLTCETCGTVKAKLHREKPWCKECVAKETAEKNNPSPTNTKKDSEKSHSSEKESDSNNNPWNPPTPPESRSNSPQPEKEQEKENPPSPQNEKQVADLLEKVIWAEKITSENIRNYNKSLVEEIKQAKNNNPVAYQRVNQNQRIENLLLHIQNLEKQAVEKRNSINYGAWIGGIVIITFFCLILRIIIKKNIKTTNNKNL